MLREARAVAIVWHGLLPRRERVRFPPLVRRRRLRPFPAVQIGFIACGVSGLIALVALHWLRPGLQMTRPMGDQLRDEPSLIAAFPALMLLLMAVTCLLEWSARKQRARSKGRA